MGKHPLSNPDVQGRLSLKAKTANRWDFFCTCGNKPAISTSQISSTTYQPIWDYAIYWTRKRSYTLQIRKRDNVAWINWPYDDAMASYESTRQIFSNNSSNLMMSFRYRPKHRRASIAMRTTSLQAKKRRDLHIYNWGPPAYRGKKERGWKDGGKNIILAF